MSLDDLDRLLRTMTFTVAKGPPLAAALFLLFAAKATGADAPGTPASAGGTAPAANWPQFRGSDARGVADHPGLPNRWSTNENVAWKVEVPGRGWSSPIVWGDRVFSPPS